ncbi:MAG TPA: hypothetical protein VHC39_02705 [Rhizomicrobium sp.]|nr:hypothetical protein [Rhizomicrobium sp.]
MRKIWPEAVIVAALLLALPAKAYSGRWLVVVNRDTGACYRVTEMPAGKNWQRLGMFNTFRAAGLFTWEHRGGVCRDSPVFR